MKMVLQKIILFLTRYIIGFENLITTWICKLQIGHVGRNTKFRKHCLLQGEYLNKAVVGSRCDFDSYCVIGVRKSQYNESSQTVLQIGDNCIFGQYNHITASNHIKIGNNLLTGRFVLISDNGHGSFEINDLLVHPSHRLVTSKGQVIIGDNVWIGDKASILPGVRIGDGCVIGANSVVTHDVPNYSMVAGNPARIIREISE